MAEEQTPAPPGIFGIDHALRALKDSLIRILTHQHGELLAALCRLERAVTPMANEFENLKQLIDDQGGVIAQEAAQINARLDENNRLIEELRGQVGNDPRLVALADQLRTNNQAIGAFIPDSVPEPTPEPAPVPTPESRRR